MAYSRVDMDAVAPLQPANKTAALATSGGDHYDVLLPEGYKHQNTPIQTRPATRREKGSPGFVDLTGVSVGRLKVLGIAEFSTEDKRRWVVKCLCGSYEVRRAKLIKDLVANPDRGAHSPAAKCQWCQSTNRLRQGYHNEKKAAQVADSIKSSM